MSVVKSKRKESILEPLAHAENMRSCFMELLVRNFGIKDLSHVARKRYILGKESDNDITKYIWYISDCKQKVLNLIDSICMDIRSANSLYPTSLHEYHLRREYQDKAIMKCECLIVKLQQIVDFFDVDVNCYKHYVEYIDREIELVKKWRQRDNKLRKRFVKESSI